MPVQVGENEDGAVMMAEASEILVYSEVVAMDFVEYLQ